MFRWNKCIVLNKIAWTLSYVRVLAKVLRDYLAAFDAQYVNKYG